MSTSTGAVGECEPGATEPCYSGPANTLGVGACVGGERTCTDGMWSECIGEVVPALESCNSGADEDCNGESPCGGFAWSRAFTGAALATGREVGFDGAGNVVVVARSDGALDLGGGLLAGAGQNDLFVARFAPDGEHLWSKRFGDAFDQFAEGGVAVAPGGDIVVGGEFKGTLDFGGGPLVAGVVASGFVAKLAADGSHVWSRAFVGAEWSAVTTVAVDAQGAAFVGGGFLGTNDFGGGALMSAGSADAFVAKFTAAGTPVWSKRFGDAQSQSILGIDATPAGGACFGGNFYGAIDLGDGPLTSLGQIDGFFGCFDPQGAPQWSRSFGTANSDEFRALAIAGDGRVHIAGHTAGIVDLGGGPLGAQQQSRGLLAQYEADGAHVWSRLASTGNSYVHDLAVDGLGAVLATGGFSGNIDFGGGVLMPFDGSDAFALKLGPDGKYVWARTFDGGYAEVSCRGVAGSATGQVAVTGSFSGKFDIGQGPVQSEGGLDGFVATFAP